MSPGVRCIFQLRTSWRLSQHAEDCLPKWLRTRLALSEDADLVPARRDPGVTHTARPVPTPETTAPDESHWGASSPHSWTLFLHHPLFISMEGGDPNGTACCHHCPPGSSNVFGSLRCLRSTWFSSACAEALSAPHCSQVLPVTQSRGWQVKEMRVPPHSSPISGVPMV